MDANTTNRTFAIATVAFLVGSLLVSGFAAAHVEDASTSRLSVIGLEDPSGATNAILHWDYDVYCDDDEPLAVDDDCDDDERTDFRVDVPSAGIVYGSTYDLFFVAIPPDATAGGLTDNEQISIYFESDDEAFETCTTNDPGDADCDEEADGDDCTDENGNLACFDRVIFSAADFDETEDFEIETDTLDLDHDQDHCEGFGFVYDEDDGECGTDIFAIAFEEIPLITGAGTYYLVETATFDVIGVFLVSELEDIDVELDPETVTYTYLEAPEVDVTATRDGEGVEDINLENVMSNFGDDPIELLLEVDQDPTSSSGRSTIDFDDTDPDHPPAGTWAIVARQDVTICGEDTACEDEDEEEFDDSTIANEPDVMGEGSFVVESNTLVVEPQSTDILSGFRQEVNYMVLFPEEAEDESGGSCDGEEGLDVALPGVEMEDDTDDESPGCNNGWLYDERESETINVSMRAPNGDRYFLNMTFADWEGGVADMPLWFCVDTDEDDEEDECTVYDDAAAAPERDIVEPTAANGVFDDGDAWEGPILVTLEDDGSVTFAPNMDFQHPLEVFDWITGDCLDATVQDGDWTDAECDWPLADAEAITALEDATGPLGEDNRVWQSGTYNITVEVSTSGRGTNDDDSSYQLTASAFADWDADFDAEIAEDLLDAADFPEYEASWDLTPASAADINMELAVIPDGADDDDATDCAGAEQSDSIDVQELVIGTVPIQTLCITVYGETIDDHPLCPASIIEDEGTCAHEDNPELDVGDDDVAADVLADAEEDFADAVEVDGDLLPGSEVVSYDAATGLLIVRLVTPTQAGNITVTVNHDGDEAELVIPTENGAQIDLDVTEIDIGIETDVTATIHDGFGGLVTTADLTLVDINGDVPATPDFDMSPSSGEISGTGAAGRGLGGEYTYAINPDVNTDLLIFALIGEGADEAYAWALVSVNPASDLEVDLSGNASAMASVTTPVMLNVTPGWDDEDEEFELSEVDVWFIHEDGWEDFTEDGAEALADLEADEDAFQMDDMDFDSDEGLVFLNATLTPGAYKILVCDVDCEDPESAHDNADDMLDFMVHMFRVTFTPAQVANDEDIEDDVRITVRVSDNNGRPASGILESVPINTDLNDDDEDDTEGEFDTDTITAVITNGWGNFTGVTGVEAGRVSFTFDPSGSSEDPTESLVDGVFNVVGPNITVTPSTVRIGVVTLVTIQVRDFDGDGLPGREINLCFPGEDDFPTDEDEIEDLEDDDFGDPATDVSDYCPTTATTGSDGSAALAVNPINTNPIRIYINGSYSGTDLPVLIGTMTLTLNPAAPNAGDSVTATATLSGVTSGSNAGISVVVTRDGTQVLNQLTNTAGQVTIANVQNGNYTVVASRTGFGNATARFTVGTVVAPCALQLENLNIPSSVNVGTLVNVSATVSNDCAAEMTETATLLVNTREQGSRNVTVAAGNSTPLAFSFTPTVAGSYTIVIRLGDENVTRTITVGVPTVTTPTTSTPVTPTGTTPSTPTGTTPVSTPTTSPTTGTPTTTSPRVPGFEVVALVAALGVALLVLRRRT